MPHTPQVISLYSGAGGLDFGLEAAGYETAVATDFNADACRTLRENRPWPVLEGDIHGFSTATLLSVAGLKPGEADLLVGGPPCQPFSKSGYWARGDSLRLDDPRAATLAAYMRVLEEALPKAFLLENVEGLAYSGKSEGVQLLLDRVREINARHGTNYVPQVRVLKAADYGVPQIRCRFFMVASREGLPFRFPTPTHVAPEERDSAPLLVEKLPTYRTAWDALADVGPLKGEDLKMKGQWAELLPSIPEGQNYLWHTDRGGGLPMFGWRRRFWTFLLKLAKNRPSWTIQAQPGPAIGPFHWESRRLGMRELCRLQTFPDDVHIVGSLSAVQRQVGNAVPSLLTEVLGRAIRVQLLGLPSLDAPLRLLPLERRPIPDPEPVGAVLEKFKVLVGQHAAHPGTGRGHRAERLGRAQVDLESRSAI